MTTLTEMAQALIETQHDMQRLEERKQTLLRDMAREINQLLPPPIPNGLRAACEAPCGNDALDKSDAKALGHHSHAMRDKVLAALKANGKPMRMIDLANTCKCNYTYQILKRAQAQKLVKQNKDKTWEVI